MGSGDGQGKGLNSLGRGGFVGRGANKHEFAGHWGKGNVWGVCGRGWAEC